MLESAVFLKESVIVLLCLLNCQSPTMRTWNFWMIYEEIYLFFSYLLSVVMTVYSSDTEMLIVVHSFLFPFFPSKDIWHWDWKSSDVSVLLFYFFWHKDTRKKLSEIQLVQERRMWPILNTSTFPLISGVFFCKSMKSLSSFWSRSS